MHLMGLATSLGPKRPPQKDVFFRGYKGLSLFIPTLHGGKSGDAQMAIQRSQVGLTAEHVVSQRIISGSYMYIKRSQCRLGQARAQAGNHSSVASSWSICLLLITPTPASTTTY